MRIFIPKNIEKSLFGVPISIGPLNLSMVQLFIIAGGSAIALLLWQNLVKSGADKVVAFIAISPIIIITFLIAFFKYSELSLIPFIAKLIRTYFIEGNLKKDYATYEVDQFKVYIQYLKSEEGTKKVVDEKLRLTEEKLKHLEDIFE